MKHNDFEKEKVYQGLLCILRRWVRNGWINHKEMKIIASAFGEKYNPPIGAFLLD